MSRVLVLLAAIALAACGGDGDDNEHPTAEEAARRFLGSFCARLESCMGSAFSAAYASTQDCVQKGIEAIPTEKRNQPDACTNAELDTCVDDVEAMQCPTGASLSLPASCQKC
jgi:hypothetical protein